MNKRIYIIALLMAAFSLSSVNAQNSNQNLNKEITLEKDVAPIDRKVTKKNELPKVKKTASTPTHTQLGYSDLTSPINVPTTIPTLLPYGYRTAHIFNDKRGYLDVGGGTQANFAGSFGYRILDEEREQLAVWLQHNSTWNSKNSSKAVPEGIERNRQKFNDNAAGVNYRKMLNAGTLSLGFDGHIDIYNYYGGWNVGTDNPYGVTSSYDWNGDKQTYYDFSVNAGWEGKIVAFGGPLTYSARAAYGHAAYDKPFYRLYKGGVHNDWANLTLAGAYELQNGAVAGLNIKGEYLTRGAKALSGYPNLKDELGMITLSPYYRYTNDRLALLLGLNAHISFSDGAAFRLSPNVRLDYALASGAWLFVNATGGKSLGYLHTNHAINRYDDPLSIYGSIYTPIDAEGGIKVGPFYGLSGKLSLGYGIAKGQPVVCYNAPDYTDPYAYSAIVYGLSTRYLTTETRGYYINAELKYKYRSLAELTAGIKYAPHDDDVYYASDDHLVGYHMGLDRASTVANVDLKVTPIRPLALNVGMEYRGGRRLLTATGDMELFEYINMKDLIDLHAGASYRLNSSLTLWLKAHNLLNRRQDMLYGMGMQRLGVMGGLALTF